MNHVHVENEVVEDALTILSHRSGKGLSDPYKDHPFYQGSIDNETMIVVAEIDSSSEDEEEHTNVEPSPNTYKPPMPYPQALNHPRAKVNEPDDHLLEAF